MALKALLGFEFYGAGNIGDDLMLEGFLECCRGTDIEITCATMAGLRIETQRARFPAVRWVQSSPETKEQLIRETDVWLGVGGTPFQGVRGSWLIDMVARDLEQAKRLGKRAFMIGVGAESETAIEPAKAQAIAAALESVWTRDAATSRYLVDRAGFPASKVEAGADLANIALEGIWPEERVGGDSRRLALNYFSESMRWYDMLSLQLFVLWRSAAGPVTLFANETRKEYEAKVYERLTSSARSCRCLPRPDLVSPDYGASSAAELVNHYESYGTVMSSRYHGILTAAWAGCRVCGLERKSSKVKALCNELGVPYQASPFTPLKLWRGAAKASDVPRERLGRLARSARRSVADLLTRLGLATGESRPTIT